MSQVTYHALDLAAHLHIHAHITPPTVTIIRYFTAILYTSSAQDHVMFEPDKTHSE